MKVRVEGLTALAVERDGKFQPAIDDGEAVFVFDAYNYSGKANAVSHAQKTIDGIQSSVNAIVANWHMTMQRKG